MAFGSVSGGLIKKTNMALIAMAVYDTEENKRTWMTRKTLESLRATVNLDRHRVVVVDNDSIPATHAVYQDFPEFTYMYLVENVGTALAINYAWHKHRRTGEHAVKMDNDVVIYQVGWADQLEEAIRRDPLIGICGLKRKDCMENPDRAEGDFFKSRLYMLPHTPGERWIIGEQVNHVMGTCQMYSSMLLSDIGYLFQPRLYGFDDALAGVRCQIAGYKSVFLPHIEIDHIDPGDTPYQRWKEKSAGEDFAEYHKIVAEYQSGQRPIYYNPFI